MAEKKPFLLHTLMHFFQCFWPIYKYNPQIKIDFLAYRHTVKSLLQDDDMDESSAPHLPEKQH
jgi:hypothetical protein